MKTDLDQSDLSPTTTKALSEVYAFLMERRIERKVAAKVPNNEIATFTKAKDAETEAND